MILWYKYQNETLKNAIVKTMRSMHHIMTWRIEIGWLGESNQKGKITSFIVREKTVKVGEIVLLVFSFPGHMWTAHPFFFSLLCS